jgi:hypothetical protein
VNLYSLFVFIEHKGDESPKDCRGDILAGQNEHWDGVIKSFGHYIKSALLAQ